MSVNGRLPATICGNHLMGGKCVDIHARCCCQPDHLFGVYVIQWVLKDRNLPFAFHHAIIWI